LGGVRAPVRSLSGVWTQARVVPTAPGDSALTTRCGEPDPAVVRTASRTVRRVEASAREPRVAWCRVRCPVTAKPPWPRPGAKAPTPVAAAHRQPNEGDHDRGSRSARRRPAVLQAGRRRL